MNFCWMCSSLQAYKKVIEFQTAEAYSNLSLTRVQYRGRRGCAVMKRRK